MENPSSRIWEIDIYMFSEIVCFFAAEIKQLGQETGF